MTNEFAFAMVHQLMEVVAVIPTSTACGAPITPCCSKAFSSPGTSPRLCRRQLCQVCQVQLLQLQQLQLKAGSSWHPMRATVSQRKACCSIRIAIPGSPWKSQQKTALGVSRRRHPHGARRRWSCYRQKMGWPASKWRNYTRNSVKPRCWGLQSCCRWSQGPTWRTLGNLWSIAGHRITSTSKLPCSRRATSTMWVANLEWLQTETTTTTSCSANKAWCEWGQTKSLRLGWFRSDTCRKRWRHMSRLPIPTETSDYYCLADSSCVRYYTSNASDSSDQ